MRLRILVFVAVLGLGGIATASVAGAQAKPVTYSEEVDNATEGRFEADESWGKSSYGKGVYDEDYRFARPAGGGTTARFEVEIPETARYAVYVRWPEVEGLNDSVPVGVETSSGVKWKRLDQQKNGGRWVRAGVYEMEEGGAYVELSPETDAEGYVAADGVRVVKVPSDDAPSRSSGRRNVDAARKDVEKDSGSTEPSGRTGEDVVREARKWMGTRYKLGRASRSGIDCSGLTMQVYKRFGVSLPHSDDAQYRYGKEVPRGQERPGDLVFFDEYGDGLISHEGIYAGNGKILHASDYFGRVTESDIEYIEGYVGARRLL